MNISSHYASLPTFVYLIYGRPSCIKVHLKLQISDTNSLSISHLHSNVQLVARNFQSDRKFSDWSNAQKLLTIYEYHGNELDICFRLIKFLNS